jgi:choloylglycine hydrolase
MKTASVIICLAANLLARQVWPCTTFLMSENDELFVGKSYDYSIGHGYVVHNKRGIAKRALSPEPGAKLAEWVSRFASLTFNQYGREMPNGGMNEAGLVVEIMWLTSTRTPEPNDRPAVNELQWIQYQLDNFATVAEVIDNAPKLRVSRVYGKVHYLGCDRSGACAAVEYLDGKLVITHGEALTAKTLTNHTYADSRTHLLKHRGFGGKRATPTRRGSLARFVRATAMARGERRKHRIDGVFEILEAVSQGDYTRWQIAYDLGRRVIHFRTRVSSMVKSVALADFEPSCAHPTLILDVDTVAAGDARPRFSPYSRAQNAELLEQSLAHVRTSLPKELAEALAAYPEQLPCTLSPSAPR